MDDIRKEEFHIFTPEYPKLSLTEKKKSVDGTVGGDTECGGWLIHIIGRTENCCVFYPQSQKTLWGRGGTAESLVLINTPIKLLQMYCSLQSLL